MKPLTDLEAAALGCILQKGGCTAYALRREFRESPSARFSDSTGSVYPMLTRLTDRKLLRPKEEKQGQRDATRYHCTAKGQAALREWIAVPAESARLVTWDPLRTRVLYLEFLSAAERRHWLDRADLALAEHLQTTRKAAKESEDPWTRLAHRNSILQASARQQWLRELRSALKAAPRKNH